jgi:hypothetical protein
VRAAAARDDAVVGVALEVLEAGEGESLPYELADKCGRAGASASVRVPVQVQACKCKHVGVSAGAGAGNAA